MLLPFAKTGHLSQMTFEPNKEAVETPFSTFNLTLLLLLTEIQINNGAADRYCKSVPKSKFKS